MLLVINGGLGTLKTIDAAMAHGTPVVVVAASGGIATAIWQYFESGGSINRVDPQYQTQGEIRGQDLEGGIHGAGYEQDPGAGSKGRIRGRDLRAKPGGRGPGVGSEQDPRAGSEGWIQGGDPSPHAAPNDPGCRVPPSP